MATRMLIDARHPEETRVAVVKGNRIDEFDFESAEHKQIKGNIYLAKVTRVEPSLQAAFVDFGGNRHGFLAFSEIHPDYYQIPREDREALLAEEAEAAEEEAALRAAEDDDDQHDDAADDGGSDDDESSEAFADEMAGDDGIEEIDTSEKDEVSTIEDGNVEDGEAADDASDDSSDRDEDDSKSRRRGRGRRRQGGRARTKEIDEVRAKRMALRRRYKIQDVIQRRQVLLVQVVKEERGNKGAALTTYLSLAGRYCVLMPNSSNGGGISRKINSGADRKRLKQIVSEMSLPKSMGCIVRTAGLQRTKTEIKRDFDYLARLWDEIRERTLGSTAPKMIHTDSDLIKRAIRDIYNREIEEVVVEGEEGYKAAKQFMKLLMPSHARRVKAYSDPVPLFQRYGAEDQLSAMYDPVVQLKSGGYLVINPTEALVSIDINSGRSTKEHGIEQTALSTNLEATREIARHLRLRDMAGLVVIDFIDMEYNNNVRKVERAMKDALKNDRARIQVGRISSFGLMEMSRQRLRTGVLEATTRSCPHCDGTGLVRTASSAGLSALRLIEDEAAKGKGSLVTLHASMEAAVYLLNSKRADLAEIEQRYGVSVEVVPEGEDEGAKMRVGSSGPRPAAPPKFEPIVDNDVDDILDPEDEAEEEETFEAEDERSDDERSDDGAPRKRRRRGGRGRNRRRDSDENIAVNDTDVSTEGSADENEPAPSSDDDDAPKKRRRRGGRRRRKPSDEQAQNDAEHGETMDVTIAGEASDNVENIAIGPIEAETDNGAEGEAGEAEAPAKPKRTRRKKAPADEASEADAAPESAAPAESDAPKAEEEAPAKPKRTRRKKAPAAQAPEADADATPESGEPAESDAPKAEDDTPAKPKRARRKKAPAAQAPEADAAPEVTEVTPEPEPQPESVAAPATAENIPEAAPSEANQAGAEAEPAAPARRGWWQRTFGD